MRQPEMASDAEQMDQASGCLRLDLTAPTKRSCSNTPAYSMARRIDSRGTPEHRVGRHGMGSLPSGAADARL